MTRNRRSALGGSTCSPRFGEGGGGGAAYVCETISVLRLLLSTITSYLRLQFPRILDLRDPLRELYRRLSYIFHLPPRLFSSNYYYFITPIPSPHFSRPFPRYSIKQSGPIKRRGKKKISIASRGELAFSIWPPGDRPGNKPRRFFDRQIITLERSPKEGRRLLVTCWKEYTLLEIVD